MKKLTLTIFLAFSIAFTSYSQLHKANLPVEEPAQVLKNLDSFLQYMGDHVNFYEDYIAYNEASNPISKETYFKALVTGKYIPLRLASNNSAICYRLYKLKPADKKLYGEAVQGWAEVAYEDYKREGKKLPAFNFVDLKGNVYNKQTTSGKIVVLKTWFVACSTCEVQRPAFNQVVRQYKSRKDIIFTSLANDPKQKVESFLKTKQMDYMVVPNQLNYIRDKLNVNGYPTYFIIDRDGTIARVVDTPEDVAYVLRKLL